MAALRGASLEVEVHSHDYQASLPKSTWLSMMRSRFWSTFSHCSDEELEAVGWGGRRGGPTAVGGRGRAGRAAGFAAGQPGSECQGWLGRPTKFHLLRAAAGL